MARPEYADKADTTNLHGNPGFMDLQGRMPYLRLSGHLSYPVIQEALHEVFHN